MTYLCICCMYACMLYVCVCMYTYVCMYACMHACTKFDHVSYLGFFFPAVQMWRLATFMPFFVGHVIPREQRHWTNFVKLLQLMSLAMAHIHTNETAQYPALVVADYLEEFYFLYPDLGKRPKQHYAVHFTRLILKYVRLKGWSQSGHLTGPSEASWFCFPEKETEFTDSRGTSRWVIFL